MVEHADAAGGQAAASAWMRGLPAVVLERARLCASQRGVPLELAALVALAAVSASLGKGFAVRSGHDRQTRGNLFLLLGVPSGVGKSEVFRDLVGPILAFESALHAWWAEEATPRARAGEEVFKGIVSALRARVRNSGRPSLDLFRQVQACERRRVRCQRFLEPPCLLCDDSTPEALLEIMARSGESAAVVSPDARSFLKRLAVADTTLEGLFLKCFSGDLALTHRVSRRAARLEAPCLTAILLTQSDAYRRFVSKISTTGSGLLPRFLHAEISEIPAMEPTSPFDPLGADRVRGAYAELLRGLLETYRFRVSALVVAPEEGARSFLQEQERTFRNSPGATASTRTEILRRRAEQAWRVALCLHGARHARRAHLKTLSAGDARTALHLVEWLTPE